MMAKAGMAGTIATMFALVLGSALPLSAQDSSTTTPGDVPISLEGDDALGDPGGAGLTVSGFGVAGYQYDARTSDNSFGAGKLAVGLFRELGDYTYVYGQLTTAVSDEGETESEIDNLLISTSIPGASAVSFTLGKLDLPIGFERDDEPLQFLASPSYNFELARPVKLVGVMGAWSATPQVRLAGFLFNGWDDEGETNHGKTVGARAGFLPLPGLSLGLSGLYGAEGEAGDTHNRFLLDADYAWQPSWQWIFAGEANWGGDREIQDDGSDATWSGAMLTLLHQFTSHVGVAARAEVFKDADGARTGVPQTLTSYSLAPLFSMGVGRDGMFANVEHTTFRIPRLQLRLEARLNHSTVPVFETSDGVSQWGTELRASAVTTF
ncbi:MAG TPA: outer membrane beta-barrel protein [Gemmatimonadales bacterium]|nr:outer membrane beta-barrel protein [Gemmatimonadales bacterium]